jgi:hypothetical protein
MNARFASKENITTQNGTNGFMFQNTICLLHLPDFNCLSGEKMLKNILMTIFFSLIAWLGTVTPVIVEKAMQSFACLGDEDVWVVELYLHAF